MNGQKQPKFNRLIQKALAVRQQIVDRLLQGKLDYERDMLILAHELETMARLNETFAIGRLFTAMGAIELQRGHFIAAYDYMVASLDSFQAINDENQTISALSNLGEVHRQWGKHEEAIDYFEQARAMARKAENWRLLALIVNNIAMIRLEDGDTEQALTLLNRALDYAKRGDGPYDFQSEMYRVLAEAELRQGNTETAWQSAERALELAQHYNRSQDIGAAYRTLGIIAAKTGQGQESPEAYFKNSRDLFRAGHNQAEDARTMVAEAEWNAANGQLDVARSKLADAMQTFERLKLSAEVEKAQALLAEYNR